MTYLDWGVLFGTLLTIVAYGTWKTRQNANMQDYLKGGNNMNWYTIGLSIMATQASAITFLSTPGQAYEYGMGFVQFYFGLPIAMVIISVFFLPIYYRLKVYTAYEYLENRFDLRTRLFTAFLFLVSRGLAAGITIYAPAIILSSLLGWNLTFTNVVVGAMVIIYTVSGGTRAVSVTQKWQMAVILLGMVAAFVLIVRMLPAELGFWQSLEIAGALGRMEVIDFSFDVESRYTVWSGLTGGLFLALSYFGTDQSQVQRYLTGKSLTASRIGLMFNGMLKIPMQFFILLVGIMVFIFYQFNEPPVFFNKPGKEIAMDTDQREALIAIEEDFKSVHRTKKEALIAYMGAKNLSEKEGHRQAVQQLQEEGQALRKDYQQAVGKASPLVETRDSDYIFLSFILDYLPHGIIGLLLAVILSAAMSSTAGELNALASTTTVDFVRRLSAKDRNDRQELMLSKLITLFWGAAAIGVALSASLFDNLIQLVNILGSLFYGTILGIFLVGFFLKKVGAKSIFPAAIIAELTVLVCHLLTVFEVFQIGYLWYNVIGCFAVVVLAYGFQQVTAGGGKKQL